ncbi:MAG TPA: cyclic nucleotide-binding domain-containing protein [Rhodocyclaceae bacterium]|nr:cyclic nucleotide-binding domain-containing protein [Rhodocyclaceae bacterium]
MAHWIKETFDFHDVQRIMFRLIERVDVFHGLSQQEVLLILETSEKCVFDPGGVIVREGSSGAYLYVIIEGRVSVIKGKSSGGGTELAQLEPGNSFGEVSLVDNGVRSATVIALTPCVMLRIEEQQCWNHPVIGAKIYRNLARILAQRLREMDEAYVLNRRAS